MSESFSPRIIAKRIKDRPPESCPHIESLQRNNPGTQEGDEALRQARPEYYGRLAKPMENIINAAYDSYQESGRLEFTRMTGSRVSAQPSDAERFVNTRDDVFPFTVSEFWRRALVEQVKNEVRDPQDPQNAQVLQELISSMRGHKDTVVDRDLERMLVAGCGTATFAVCRLLEIMDAELRNEGNDSVSRVEIMRKSTSPIIKAAGVSVVDVDDLTGLHMMRYLRTGFDVSSGEFPAIFSHVNDNKLRFSDEFSEYMSDLSERIPSSEQPLIGCPILLNRGQAAKMWEWGLAMGVEAGFLGRDEG